MRANRQSVRAPVVPEEIQGLITVNDTGEQIPFLIWDISETGLGLWIASAIAEKAEIRITVGQPYPLVCDAIVQWTRPDESGQGFRCGIRLLATDKHLKKLYERFKQEMEKKAAAG